MLTRIIAVLFAMAVLAERSIGDPPHLRRLVLFLLRPAEAVARGLLACNAGERSLRSLPYPTPFDGDAPEDAWRLALSFRALALALGAVLTQSSLFGTLPVQAHKPRCRSALRRFTLAFAAGPDTS
jgi:hypothetical protein